jgi:N-formylmaleamate deformylase
MRLLALVAAFVLVHGEPTAFRVEVSGQGPAMILIPGLSSSGDTWRTTVDHYKNRYTCHVVTLAGFAGVPPLASRPLLTSARDQLAAYIEAHHLDKPVIVGHSLGGTLALDLASQRPDLAGPLVVVDSLPFYAAAWFHVNSVEAARPMIGAMHAYMSAQTREQYEAYVRSGVSTKFMVSDPAKLATITDWGLRSDPQTVADAMEEMLTTDLRPALRKIASPALLIGTWAGLREQLKQAQVTLTRDQVVQTFDEQFAGLRRLHFVLSETSRHFVMFDEPDWMFARMDAFLGDPARATGDRGFAR